MDEAEFITDSRPTRKYDKDELGPVDDRSTKHSKVFLKHEKKASPTEQALAKDKSGKAVNQSMMVVPPSQADRKILSNEEVEETAGNQSLMVGRDQLSNPLNTTGSKKQTGNSKEDDKTDKSRGKRKEQTAESNRELEAKSAQLSAEQKK